MGEGMLTTAIGAITGLMTAIVTSFLIPFFQKKQEKGELRRSVHEKYAQPLAADAVNLLWRLNEILFKGRAQYLREDAPPTTFNVYKRISTSYRIAVILGWIRAIEQEQSYLFYGAEKSQEDLRRAVDDLRSALADSPHVEVHVLRRVASLWDVALPDDRDEVARIAACANAEMQHVLIEYRLARYHDLLDLNGPRQLEAVRRIAAAVTAAIDRPPVEETVLTATGAEALSHIAVRQAWIYRDWQQAVGTLMIRPIEGAARRFDVLDYGAFETLVTAGTGSDKVWVDRLEAAVTGIDAVQPDPADFRIAQLRGVARATAALVCAIERLDLERRIIEPQACALARKLLAEIPARSEG